MISLKKNKEICRNYHGFTLQSGFWYGKADDGTPVATSGWEMNGFVAVYFQKGKEWEMCWIEEEEIDPDVSDLKINASSQKMSFDKWLEETYGMCWSEFDNSSDRDEACEEYDRYLYDNLPHFVRRVIAKAA